MSYWLFLDDLRTVEMVYPGQEEKFIVVRSHTDFVSYIAINGLPDFISFDNDLGENEEGNIMPEGYDCAKWLVYQSGLDLKNLKFMVHSANPVAKVNIVSLLNNYIAFLREG
jgi:hypothetical protein